MNTTSLHVDAAKVAQDFRFIKKNYFSSKGNLFHYCRYRVLRPYLKMYNQFLMRKDKDAPWLSPAAVAILNSILSPSMVGFEFGSGRSTIWIAKKIKNLVSIEHNREWFNKISGIIVSEQIQNITYKLIEPDLQKKAKRNFPKNSYENILMNHAPASCYQKYYGTLASFPAEHFDFIIVDGRARTECCLIAMDRIAKGGFLVLDNSERERYRPAKEALSKWPSVQTTTGLTDTTIWFKS